MLNRHELASLLRSSGKTFSDSFRDLDQTRFGFKPGPGRWSIAENVEHVIVSETGSVRLIRGKLLREPTPPEDLAAAADGWARVEARLSPGSGAVEAPDFVRPTGRWQTPAEMLEAFESSRAGLIEFIETTEHDLTRHAALHPRLGMLDGWQWAYFIALHGLRHAAQIDAVKRDPGYPR
ncbi:MAG: DinB family protein [Gemmatimonadales bacterium]|nr:DinB family protein [Gemmatimonadales bacterium]